MFLGIHVYASAGTLAATLCKFPFLGVINAIICNLGIQLHDLIVSLNCQIKTHYLLGCVCYDSTSG